MATKKIKPTSRNTLILNEHDFFDWKTGQDFLNVFESPHDFFEKLKTYSYSYSGMPREEISKYSVQTYLNQDFCRLLTEYSKTAGFNKTYELVDMVSAKIIKEEDVIKAIDVVGEYFKNNEENVYLLKFSDDLMKKVLSAEPWRDVFAALYWQRFTEIRQKIKKMPRKTILSSLSFGASLFTMLSQPSSEPSLGGAKKEELAQENQFQNSYLPFEEAVATAIAEKNYEKINMSQEQFETKVLEMRELLKKNSNYNKIFFNDGSNLISAVEAVFSKLSHTHTIEPTGSKYFIDQSPLYSVYLDEAIAAMYTCPNNYETQALGLIREMKKSNLYKSSYSLNNFWEPIVAKLSLEDIVQLFKDDTKPFLEAARKFASFIVINFIDAKKGVWSQGEALELKKAILEHIPVAEVIEHAIGTEALKEHFYTPEFLFQAFEASPLLMRPLASYLKIIKDEEQIKKIIQESFLNKDMCPSALPKHWLDYKLWQNLDYSALNSQREYTIDILQKNINLFKNIGFAKKMLEQKNYKLFGRCVSYKTISRQQDLMLEYISADKNYANLSAIFLENDNAKDAEFILKAAALNIEVLEHARWSVWEDLDFCVRALELIEEREAKIAKIDMEEGRSVKVKSATNILSTYWALEKMNKSVVASLKAEAQEEMSGEGGSANNKIGEQILAGEQKQKAIPILYSVKLKALKEKLDLKVKLKTEPGDEIKLLKPKF